MDRVASDPMKSKAKPVIVGASSLIEEFIEFLKIAVDLKLFEKSEGKIKLHGAVDSFMTLPSDLNLSPRDRYPVI